MAVDYKPGQRERNQRNIVLTVAALCAIVLISGLLQSWPIGAFIGIFAVIGACAFVVWKLFASSDARPLPTNRKYARWPYWVTKERSEETYTRRK